MSCDFMQFLDAYVDHELDEQDALEVQAHLQGCASCRGAVAAKVAYKEGLKRVCTGGVPVDLESRMWARIDSEPVTRSDVSSYRWVGLVAAAVALVFFVPMMLTVTPASSSSTTVIDQTLDWHRGNFPVEVTGESAQVADWFSDKVDFPVRLPHLADARLVGARIAHVEDRRAAYAVYELDGTRLSVLVFDGKDLKVPVEHVRRVNDREMVLLNHRGYEVAVVQHGGVTYSVASELESSRFMGLVSQTFR